MNHLLLPFVALSLALGPVMASDANIVSALRAKGADVVETKGEVTGLTFKNNASLAAADYALIHQLPQLKTLSFGQGFDDAGLKALAGLPALEQLSTNGMAATDEGITALALIKPLRSIAFFHPGKTFSGTGLAVLSHLQNLQRLTVAGSTEFGNAGMAAVAQLTQLKEFRTWHNGVTMEGVKSLSSMQNLKSLTLGQRLAFAPPAGVNDKIIASLTEMKSLETLSLQEARLSLAALTPLKSLTKLKKLSLDNIEIPEADMKTLREQLPQTQITWTAPSETAKKRIQGLFGK